MCRIGQTISAIDGMKGSYVIIDDGQTIAQGFDAAPLPSNSARQTTSVC